MINTIAIQDTQKASVEAKAAHLYSILSDDDISLKTVSESPNNPTTLPIGTVKFVHETLMNLNVEVPGIFDYPACLKSFLHRDVILCQFGEVSNKNRWIKSCSYDKPFLPQQYKNLVGKVDDKHLVWCSELVEWQCEYRYYVLDNNIIFYNRYDPFGEDNAPESLLSKVQTMVDSYKKIAPRGYVLDVGVLSDGTTALIEMNDGYAIGLYGSVTPTSARAYIKLLISRYEEICTKR